MIPVASRPTGNRSATDPLRAIHTQREAMIVRLCMGVLVALLITASMLGPFGGDSKSMVALSIPSVPDEIRIRLKAVGYGPWEMGAPFHIQRPTGHLMPAGTTVSHDAVGLLVNGQRAGAELHLYPQKGDSIVVNDRTYPGSCSVHFRREYNDAVMIDHVETEDYVSHVLPAEMPLHYPDAALLSQAVAIRTYGLWQAQRRKDRLWDVTDGQASQVFVGGMATPASRALVLATKDQVLTFEDELLPAYYSAICGGATRSNQEAFGAEELRPLSGVSCSHCRWTRSREWQIKVQADHIMSALELNGPLLGIRLNELEGSGYDNDVIVETEEGEVSFPTDVFRRHIGKGLKSSWFTKALLRGETLVIEGRGFGHGVGLCQTGARGLAQMGQSYGEVLEFYYPGARLIRLEN